MSLSYLFGRSNRRTIIIGHFMFVRPLTKCCRLASQCLTMMNQTECSFLRLEHLGGQIDHLWGKPMALLRTQILALSSRVNQMPQLVLPVF